MKVKPQVLLDEEGHIYSTDIEVSGGEWEWRFEGLTQPSGSEFSITVKGEAVKVDTDSAYQHLPKMRLKLEIL